MNSPEKYISKHYKDLLSSLESYNTSPETETLHAIRLELKKIRTFCFMMDHCLKDFDGRQTFEPLKKIFRRAGKIRELYLANTLILKNNPDSINVKYCI